LVRLLSKPDNWNLNINYMVKTGKQGRTAIRSSIAELEKAGYINRQVLRTKSERIIGTEYHVYEDAVAGNQIPTAVEQARAVLNALLDKYANEGVRTIKNARILRLKPFSDMGTPVLPKLKGYTFIDEDPLKDAPPSCQQNGLLQRRRKIGAGLRNPPENL